MKTLRILAMTFSLALAVTSASAAELNARTGAAVAFHSSELSSNNKSALLTLPGAPKAPQIRPGKSLKSWSGYWTWNPITKSWVWTWIWIASATGWKVS